MIDESNIPIQKIIEPFFQEKGVELFVKREDLIHLQISGNKWRKLKYNILKAKTNGSNKIFTFGGAFSNHIAATAAAGKLHGIATHAFIRGDELQVANSTLVGAQRNGMTFTFVSREHYKLKSDLSAFLKGLDISESDGWFIPEGGGNVEGVQGCSEIANGLQEYNLICCACGTGSTLAGIVNGMHEDQFALGFPVLKNASFLFDDVERFLAKKGLEQERWDLNLDSHFGGYAKMNEELVRFIQGFWKDHGLKLDPIYTGKAMLGLYNFIREKKTSEPLKIVFIHTGGLQGVKGFEQRYGVKLFEAKL